MSEIPRPFKNVDWSRASLQDLKKYFKYYTGNEYDLHELASGAVYAQMISANYPALLDKQRIQLNPSCQGERALNWTLLKMALSKLPFDKEISPVERSRWYGNADIDFCRYFVAFYEKSNGCEIRNINHKQEPKKLRGGGIYRMLDDYAIRKDTESIRQPYDLNSVVPLTNEEQKALDLKRPKPAGQAILELFGVEDVTAITEDMIVQWKASQNQNTTKQRAEGKDDKPSMWDYDSRCFPYEFDHLKPEKFLVNPMEKNLSLLPTEILSKICEKLNPRDFVHLSMSCRFLHWRMFTFCTCFAHHTLYLEIAEVEIDPKRYYPKKWLDLYYKNGNLYGWFITQPAKLPKPFFFNLLEVFLILPQYNEQYYERCLPLVNRLRSHANKCVIMLNYVNLQNGGIDYHATDEFFKATKATSFRGSDQDITFFPDNSSEIFNECPITQKMEDVLVEFLNGEASLPPEFFQNKTGVYSNAPCMSVMNTVELILTGKVLPAYHFYLYESEILPDDDIPKELLQWFFSRFDFEEFYSTHFGHIWITKIAAEETGRRYMMRIVKNADTRYHHRWYYAIAIGDEKNFDELEKRYQYIIDWSYSGEEMRWKMETAIEGDDEWSAAEDDSTEEATTDEAAEEKAEEINA